MKLTFSEVEFAYGKHRVLNAIDLTLASRDIVVLTGANGAGKTTLLRLAIGLLLPAAGSIELDGQSLHARTVAQRKRFGYVPTDSMIYPGLTVSLLKLPFHLPVEEPLVLLTGLTLVLLGAHWLGAGLQWDAYFVGSPSHSTSDAGGLWAYLAWSIVLCGEALLLGWWRKRSAALGMVVFGAFPTWHRMREEYRADRWRIAPGRHRETLRILARHGLGAAGLSGLLVGVGPERACAVQVAGGVAAASACFVLVRASAGWAAFAVVICTFAIALQTAP